MIMNASAQVLFTANNTWNPNDWRIVNDGVMGGVSQAEVEKSSQGTLVFSGTVRLENNGGFASVRRSFEPQNITGHKTIKLRIKGDGTTYQFRLKSTQEQRYSYVHEFQTTGHWEDLELPLSDFQPRFRGQMLDRPNYTAKVLQEIAILIGNKRKESFRLEIQEIVLP